LDLMNDDAMNFEHLSEDQLVAFLGGEVEAEDRRALEQHLATCAECRDELVAVTELLRPLARDRFVSWRIFLPTAAAAAAILLALAGPIRQRLVEEPRHRDTPAQVAHSPTPVAPLGEVDRVDHLVWRAVTGADRYRLTLFDRDAKVIWQATTADTITQLPDSVRLARGATYLWRLEARVGWDLWESSDLVRFTVTPDLSP
jgi:hypothetical protein